MTDLSQVRDADLVREIYRPISAFFDKQNVDAVYIRMGKLPDWEALEAGRDEALAHFPERVD
ncbi:hypothetical protein [Methylomagnum ishizawai]|uniref:hypothetical protein n=1 Tax=Methylomagnum ishizawai TaxID=1760988 RepID=UPI001C32F5F2|nr:hypothetical protein [Methylomagnum ishizawai]BBL75866.1 hypothetical protein MishRS11D_29640 [Methylomagnum ishizawai]